MESTTCWRDYTLETNRLRFKEQSPTWNWMKNAIWNDEGGQATVECSKVGVKINWKWGQRKSQKTISWRHPPTPSTPQTGRCLIVCDYRFANDRGGFRNWHRHHPSIPQSYNQAVHKRLLRWKENKERRFLGVRGKTRKCVITERRFIEIGPLFFFSLAFRFICERVKLNK